MNHEYFQKSQRHRRLIAAAQKNTRPEQLGICLFKD
jgi:hypothetical protein